MIDATVVIASFETRALLLDCLASVERAQRACPEWTFETIVVDNGSSDGSAAAVRDRFPDVRLVARVRNRGFASAMNCGLRSARGRTTLLLNSDVEIDGAMLAGGLRILDGHADIGILGPRLVHPDGRPQRSVHRLPNWRTEFLPLGWIDRLTERLGPGQSERGSGRGGAREVAQRVPALTEIDVEAVRGAVLFLRTSMLEKVGLLNESFFFFLEETEYCGRARKAGYRVVWAPGLVACHQLGASSKRRAPIATRIEFHRSLYRFLALEHGPVLAFAAKLNRSFRTTAGLIARLPLLPFSSTARERFAQRGALLLWHLQGCPVTPRLADSLAARGAGGVSANGRAER